MGKRFVIGILLTALALSGIPWIHGLMDEKKDDVEIYETVLAGSPQAASGLKVKAVTHMDQRLLWETVFWPGSDAAAETVFSYYPDQKPYRYEYDFSHLTVSFAEGNYGIGGGYTMEELETGEVGCLWNPIVDVAKRTPAGTIYSETISLRDYYEFYPLRVNMYMDRYEDGEYFYINETQEANDHLTEFFAVKVPEEVELTVTVAKSSDDMVREIDCQYADSIENNQLGYLYGNDLGIHAALTPEGGYMVMAREKKDPNNSYETVLDSPRLTEDYGIYFFPLTGQGPERVVAMDQLGNVFPMGEGVNAVGLHHHGEGDQLILITEEGGHLWATVICRKTMTELQKLDLGPYREEEYVDQVKTEENLLMVSVMEIYNEEKTQIQHRMVMLVEEDDLWSVALSTPLSWPEQKRYVNFDDEWRGQFLWDGQRLAIVQWENYYSSCGVYVLICAENQLNYVGKYERKDTDGDIGRRNGMIEPWHEENGLEIFWN